MKFTPNEINLLADTLNGCGTSIAVMEHYIQTMTSDRGAIAGIMSKDQRPIDGSPYLSGLELEVHDAITLNQADRHWDVNGPELLAKIRALSPADRESIIRAIGRAWDDCNGPTWDKELGGLLSTDFHARKHEQN